MKHQTLDFIKSVLWYILAIFFWSFILTKYTQLSGLQATITEILLAIVTVQIIEEIIRRNNM